MPSRSKGAQLRRDNGSVPSSTQPWAWCSFLPSLQRAPQRRQEEPTSLAGTLILRSSLTTRSYLCHRSSTSSRVGAPSARWPARNISTRPFTSLMRASRCRRADIPARRAPPLPAEARVDTGFPQRQREIQGVSFVHSANRSENLLAENRP